MIEHYCHANEAPKKPATPYDNFCSRDSRLLSEVYAEGKGAGILTERKRLGEWLKQHMFDDSIWTDGYADALTRGECPQELDNE